jgi:hypothetical protein
VANVARLPAHLGYAVVVTAPASHSFDEEFTLSVTVVHTSLLGDTHLFVEGVSDAPDQPDRDGTEPPRGLIDDNDLVSARPRHP